MAKLRRRRLDARGFRVCLDGVGWEVALVDHAPVDAHGQPVAVLAQVRARRILVWDRASAGAVARGLFKAMGAVDA